MLPQFWPSFPTRSNGRDGGLGLGQCYEADAEILASRPNETVNHRHWCRAGSVWILQFRFDSVWFPKSSVFR